MDDRMWATFATQSGIQADRTERSFTPTWTGFSVAPVGDISYYDFGAIVVLWNDTAGQIVGTSDANTMVITNLPDAITPDNSIIGQTIVIDNSGAYEGQFSITSSNVLGFTLMTVSGAFIQAGVGGLFTAAGNKGLPTGWLIVYAK